MGCQDIPWMKVPVGLSVIPESLQGIAKKPLETEQSAAEYGFNSMQENSISPNRHGKKKAR